MPKVIYENFLIILYHAQPCVCSLQINHSATLGIMEEICVRVGNSYVPTEFIVVNTGTDERSPMILG